MGLLSKLRRLWRRSDGILDEYTLRVTVRGVSGETAHEFITFEAESLAAAVQHAWRRVQQRRPLRWKLFDVRKRIVASGFGAGPLGKSVISRA